MYNFIICLLLILFYLDHLIIFNDDSLDVVEATPEALKMYTIIQRRLNKVCKEYEDNWSPSKTVNDIRVLRLIIGPDNWY